YYSGGGSLSLGVALFPGSLSQVVTDLEGRLIIVHGRWGAKLITFASIYAPNFDDPLMIQNFFLKLAQYPSQWIIGGDFNCPMDTAMDKSSATRTIPSQMARAIQASMMEYGPIDVWRHLHPATMEYTHYSHVHKSFSRIDLFLISPSLIHWVKDHSPVLIQVEVPGENRGPYQWRLDPQLLTKEDFMREIGSAIHEYFRFNSPPASPPDIVWEAFKATIRGRIIALSSAYKQSFHQRQVKLERDLRGAETDLYKNNSAERGERVASPPLQHNLNVLSSAKAERALLKTRSKFYARGDKAGKLLAWQLRKEEADRHIPSITSPDGTASFIPSEINEVFLSYYASLYS
uniref:Endonuclease/exonuclease/phosphatase domain-containing protein n=1 Tax=Latimeria chalumnae TaxID=7897 RepID=H2ZRT3_LATCH